MPDPFVDLVPEGLGIKIIPEISAYDFEYWNGRLLIWEPPDVRARYTMGIDPGHGKGEDRSTIEIIRNGDLERPDEQVAEFASNFHGPVEISGVAATIGRLYGGLDGEALAIVECNTAGGGDTTLFDLRSRYQYDNLFVWKLYDKIKNLWTQRLGWWTNQATRPKLIARGLHALSQGDLLLHSPFLLDEMEDFEGDLFLAKAKAKFGRHDDRVMAILMAHWGAHDEEWLAGEDVAGDRKRLTTAERLRDASEERSGTKPSWQASDVSFQGMMDAWEAAMDE